MRFRSEGSGGSQLAIHASRYIIQYIGGLKIVSQLILAQLVQLTFDVNDMNVLKRLPKCTLSDILLTGGLAVYGAQKLTCSDDYS